MIVSTGEKALNKCRPQREGSNGTINRMEADLTLEEDNLIHNWILGETIQFTALNLKMILLMALQASNWASKDGT